MTNLSNWSSLQDVKYVVFESPFDVLTKGVVAFPSPTIGVILTFGLVIVLLGIHLQAQAKPDE